MCNFLHQGALSACFWFSKQHKGCIQSYMTIILKDSVVFPSSGCVDCYSFELAAKAELKQVEVSPDLHGMSL